VLVTCEIGFGAGFGRHVINLYWNLWYTWAHDFQS